MLHVHCAVLSIAIALITFDPLVAQSPRFHRGDLHGRSAYFLENDKLRIAALRGAGHIAEIRLKSADPRQSINPMRVPHFPTIEPWEYDPEIHDEIYGSDTSRVLQSGYMGHLLNFPRFGGPSEFEAKNGLGNHGEALAVPWDLDRTEQTEDVVKLWYSAHLPKSRYNVGRVLSLRADETVLHIEEWVESLTDFDRPAHWVQHVTFGPPFVEPGRTVLDMSASAGLVRGRGGETNSLMPGEVTWPDGRSFDDKTVSLRPMQTRSAAGTYAAFLMDPEREHSFFTMYHRDYRVLIGYLWRTEDFPWMGDWQENGRNQQIPWNGKVRARGMEFGTTPFGGPMRKVIADGPLFGKPTYRWIGGRERVTVRYLAFITPIPPGFEGVADVRLGGGAILVTERKTGGTMSLASARRL